MIESDSKLASHDLADRLDVSWVLSAAKIRALDRRRPYRFFRGFPR